MTKPLTPEELDEITARHTDMAGDWCDGSEDVARLVATICQAWQEREIIAARGWNAGQKQGRLDGLEEAAQAFEPLREAAEAGQIIAWDSRRLVAHVISTIRALKATPHKVSPNGE